MTLDEFIDELSKTRGWHTRDDGAIRNELCDCPIEALIRPTGINPHWSGYYRLGLEAGVATLIMNAADNERGHIEGLRARLLKACGLVP